MILYLVQVEHLDILIDMRRTKAYSTVNWRKYLDVKTNPRAQSFLESRGDDVLWQISSNIHQSIFKKGMDELVLLIHPNAGAVIKIDKKEYKEVLNLALSWFVFREDYKKCSTIKSFIGDLEKQNISIKRERKVVQTLI